MKINDAKFVISAVRRSQYPNDSTEEYLLVGRSNVGKSSFINAIADRKNLARTSARPGKTQTLNFYLFNNQFYFIDVPGYGYASINKKEQRKMGMMVEEYLEKRENLKRVFMLIDLRHRPSDDDVMMYKFLKYYDIKTTLVATKADKLSKNKREKAISLILNTIKIVQNDNLVVFSCVTNEGREDILKIIDDENIETI